MHMVTAAEVLVGIAIVNADWYRKIPTGRFPWEKLLIAIIIISFPFFAQLDARSRYQNYKMLRDKFYQFGFHQRLVKPFGHSSCQRQAAYIAASHFGYRDLCKGYFDSLGYRWYHILPDFMYKKPVYFIKAKFWTTTFLVRYYKSKISYQDIQKKGIALRKIPNVVHFDM